MRMLKILGMALGGLVVLAIVLLLAAALLIHPNAYRGRIEQAVQHATGRTLQLDGDLHLRVLPAIALRLGPARLGNPPGFPSTPFLTLREASLRVRLLPLLRGQLQVGHVQIDGLDVQLLRNARGQGNWEFTGTGSGAPAASAAPSSAGASGLRLP